MALLIRITSYNVCYTKLLRIKVLVKSMFEMGKLCFELGIGVDNIFDFTDTPDSNSDLVFITNIPGRILYARLNFQF